MRKRWQLSGRSTRTRSDWEPVLIRSQRARLMQRLPEVREIEELAWIYRAQNGDKVAQETVTVGEASLYEPARTFAEFLRVNRLPVYEEVLR